MADIVGKISAELHWQAGRIVNLSVSSSRPAEMGRLFAGRSVSDIARMLPLLFSACSVGQRLALARAVEQCRGVGVARDVALARQLMLQLENCRELLLRLLQHWVPSTAGQTAGQAVEHSVVLQQLQGLITGVQRRLGYLLEPCATHHTKLNADQFRDQIQGEQRYLARQLQSMLVPLLGMPAQQFPDWIQTAAPEYSLNAVLLMPLVKLQREFAAVRLGPDLPGLPDLHQPEQQKILKSDYAQVQQTLFCATPVWQQQCCETGSYSMSHDALQGFKQQGWHELSCRYAAVLLQLSHIPGIMLQGSSDVLLHLQNPAQAGYGVVDTARGQLLHRIDIEGERVKRYQIVAPTEWNLHPAGLLAAKLQGVETETELQALSLCRKMLLLADPCVEFEIKLKV